MDHVDPAPAILPALTTMKGAICTLFEGHYHLGAGALINSLHAGGFTGLILCGHRGAVPPWAESARTLSSEIDVRFVPVSTGVHLTFYKPTFMRECWEKYASDFEQLYYFDPDIVAKAPWPVLTRWASDGLALCEDVNAYLPARHPFRLAWTDFLAGNGIPVVRSLERYYNAGFIGVPRAHREFLTLWETIIGQAERQLGSLSKIKYDKPYGLLPTPDQDAMNMALMASEAPINGVGPEGMDFLPGGYLLSHAIGRAKPWRGAFLKQALHGSPPGPAHKAFFRFVEKPLKLFPEGKLARLRLSLRSAALLGRVYRRA